MSRRAALLAATAASAMGCGSPARDLFVVDRSGTIPGARLVLRVTDDGFAVCNGRAKRQLPGDLLLDARALERDLEQPAADRVSLPRGPRSILTYRVRTAEGEVRFSDTSRPQPPVFFRTAGFVREVAKRACGLPR